VGEQRTDILPGLSQEEFARRVEAQEKAEQEARRARSERHERESAKRTYLSEGGTEAGFAADWPTIKAEGLRRRTAEREEERRRQSDRSYELNF
jgi:hypothetical protein